MPPEKQELIISTKTVPQHLCCYNPYWLYRIYQDTILHINEITALIQDGLEESRHFISSHILHPPENMFNMEYTNVAPPIVKISDISCLSGETRDPGSLWVSWKEPWTKVKVDKWIIKIENTGRYYETPVPMVSIDNFEPGTDVYFAVKGMIGDVEQVLGEQTYCTV